MSRQQGPFDWQGRLESEGSVTFGAAPWQSWLWCGVAVAVLGLFAYAVASGGPAAWSLIGTALIAVCAVFAARAAWWGTGRLTVSHAGFATGRRDPIPFDRLGATSISRRNLTLHYRTPPAGQRRLLVPLPRFGSFHPDDLAIWLLKLAGGPTAVVTEERTGVSRVFRIEG